jgi:hypothetical protein
MQKQNILLERMQKDRELAEKRAGIAKRKAQSFTKQPPKTASLAEQKAWYARNNLDYETQVPESGKRTLERRDQQNFYRAIRGQAWWPKLPSGQDALNVVYGNQQMPYWEQWYNRNLSARQIAELVRRDMNAYVEEARVQQNIQWSHRGQAGRMPGESYSQYVQRMRRGRATAQPEISVQEARPVRTTRTVPRRKFPAPVTRARKPTWRSGQSYGSYKAAMAAYNRQVALERKARAVTPQPVVAEPTPPEEILPRPALPVVEGELPGFPSSEGWRYDTPPMYQSASLPSMELPAL